MSAEGG